MESPAGDDDQAGRGRALQRGDRRGGGRKSTIIAPLYDAWTAAGRSVYGAALANRQATDLAAAGVPANYRSSLTALLHRVKTGRYRLDRDSVVVVDEVSLLSTRDQLALLRLQKQHGFTPAEVGDYLQMPAVEASGCLALVRRALPDIPEIVTSIRQRQESERENVRLLREGHVGEVLARKQADGTVSLDRKQPRRVGNRHGDPRRQAPGRRDRR